MSAASRSWLKAPVLRSQMAKVGANDQTHQPEAVFQIGSPADGIVNQSTDLGSMTRMLDRDGPAGAFLRDDGPVPW